MTQLRDNLLGDEKGLELAHHATSLGSNSSTTKRRGRRFPFRPRRDLRLCGKGRRSSSLAEPARNVRLEGQVNRKRLNLGGIR
jgi:hypothetical protein